MSLLNNKVVKSSIWYTIGNFLVKAIGFITTPIFTRILTKSEYGDFSNFITWVGLLTIVFTLSLSSSINRARFDFKNNLRDYMSSILLFGTFFSAIMFVVVVINIEFFENVFNLNRIYIYAIFTYLLFQPASDIFQYYQLVNYRYKTSVALSLTIAIVSSLVSVLMVLKIDDGFFARAFGYVGSITLINIIVYFYLLSGGKSIRLKYVKYAFLYSWPIVIHLLAGNVLASSDRIMINRYCGNEYAAVYMVACSAATMASVLFTSMNSAISPWIFDKLDEKNYKRIKDITFPYVSIFVIPVFIIIMLAPEILWVLGGKQYSESQDVIVPLMTSVIVQYIYCMYVNVEQYAKKTIIIAIGTVTAATINVVLNYFLLPLYGYSIAAYTTLIGYSVLFLIHFIFTRMIGYKNVYNDKLVFLLFVFVILVQFPLQLLYNHMIIRYVVLFIEVVGLVIYALKNKDTLISMLKRGEDDEQAN